MAAAEGLTSLLWVLLCAVGAPALLGAGIALSLGLSPRTGWRQFVFWAYLSGQFAQAVVTALWVATGRLLPGWGLPAIAGGLGTALLLWARRRAEAEVEVRPSGDPWLRGAVLVLVLLCIDQYLLHATTPVIVGDEGNAWSSKARMLYLAGDMRPWFTSQYVANPSYPMFNPLMQALAFASSGRVLSWENRLPLQAFGVTLLLLLSAIVERRLPRWLGIGLLIAFASASDIAFWSQTAYSDFLLACILLAVMHAWLQFEATGRRVHWRLCCIALAALLATKNEGVMLTGAFAAAAVSTRWLLRRRVAPAQLGWHWAWLLLPAATLFVGQWFNAHFGLKVDLSGPGYREGSNILGLLLHWLPIRIGPVLSFYARLLFDLDLTRWLLLAAFLAPLSWRRAELQSAQLWSWLTVVLGMTGYVLVFIGIQVDDGKPDGPARGLLWNMQTAADRTLLHLMPAAVLVLSLGLQRPTGREGGTAGAAARPICG